MFLLNNIFPFYISCFTAAAELEGLTPSPCVLFILAYNLEYAYYANKEDIIQQFDGFRVFIDPKSYVYVEGCEIDYKYEGLNEGFEFYNPKEKARCGCGESFTV